MRLLETKEQLTLNELLRIAYEYGNDGADMPADAETVDIEFSEWIETTTPLFKKLIIPRVSNNEVAVCVNCDQEKETHNICSDCLTKIINENKQTDC